MSQDVLNMRRFTDFESLKCERAGRVGATKTRHERMILLVINQLQLV